MKIISLKAENIKRLRAVTITPGPDNLVEITGRNGAGKTSVLDSLWWALAGNRSHQSRPIRQGETEARIRLDLGDVIVKRTFKAQVVEGDDQPEAPRITTRIVVETAEGARFPSPQKMLDDLVGSLSFDPLAFMRADPKGQYDALRELVGLDFSEEEAAQRNDYDARTEANRTAKAARARAAALPVDDAPEMVDVEGIQGRIAEIEAANEAVRTRQRVIDESSREISEAAHARNVARERVDELARALDGARSIAERAQSDVELKEAAHKQLPPAGEVTDLGPIREKLRAGLRSNEAAQDARLKWRQKEEARVEAEQAEEVSKALTTRMAGRVAAMRKKVGEAEMPVPGLSLEDGAVTFKGLPIDQASDADQLRISCAIAMRGNHKLRVLRIRDGSLLDVDSMIVLRDMAAEADYQVWIERVDTTGKVGFVIEDGALKGAEPEDHPDHTPEKMAEHERRMDEVSREPPEEGGPHEGDPL